MARARTAKESTIHQMVVDYLKLQYPGVIFRTDFSAGVKMTMGQAIKHKALQEGRGYPDLFIAEAGEWYHGLYLELKREGVRLMKKDGSWANEHFAEQHAYMKRLSERGYRCTFAVGFDDAKDQIDKYMNMTNFKERRKQIPNDQIF